MDVTSKLAHIASMLRKAYGPDQPQRRCENPLDSLIHALLCESTTAANGERAYASLRRRFRTWESVWEASLKDLMSAVRPGGLANIKAVHIKAMLDEIWKKQGHFDLSFLRDLSDEEVRAYLGGFKAIGNKIAAKVLLFGLGRAAFPIDGPVFRVFRRLGLLDGQRTPETAQALLEPLVPARDCHALQVHLADHSCQVCTAHHPACGTCVLSTLCAYVRRSRGND